MPGLLINLEDLIHLRAVEGTRVEFKAAWDNRIEEAVVHTIAAFANDFQNLNGGYVIIGIESDDKGMPVLPPRGLDGQDLEKIQKRIRGACTKIRPEYQPLIEVRTFQQRTIVTLFAPAGEDAPYQAPGPRDAASNPVHYVRVGPETVVAQGQVLRQLLEKAARIPFDDRRNLEARTEDLSPSLVRKFLADVRSDLATGGASPGDADLYRRLALTSRVNNHEVPRNVPCCCSAIIRNGISAERESKSLSSPTMPAAT